MRGDIGARLGPYEIEGLIGAGGMGEVYKARDNRLGRIVALKVLSSAFAADPDFRARFRREAAVIAALHHPNICTLYDIGCQNDVDFLVMEYLEGETLARRLERGRLPVDEALAISTQILDALNRAHRQGIVHRDVKPGNVFLTTHGSKLLDFGLARVAVTDLSDTIVSTEPGRLLGTPPYMAPEQILNQRVDARADLFAAGVMTFEMLSGRRPFRGDAPFLVMQAILRDRSPILTGSAAIAAADRVIRRALAKKPEDRYVSAETMAHDLRAARALADTHDDLCVRTVTRVAVLPFRLLRADPEIDFLSFSLADAIASTLSGLESLSVRSPLAARAHDGDTLDLNRLASNLEVDAVLTGTLLRVGDQLQTHSQLLAPDGTLMWSLTRQTAIADVFRLQDELTRGVLASISPSLAFSERGGVSVQVPTSAKAFELYLRANQLAYEVHAWPLARDLYERCVQEDPGYGPAWARLGRIYRVMAKFGGHAAAEDERRAEMAFAKALEIDPELPIAHNLYAQLEIDLGRPKDAMVRLLRRAEKLRPDAELYAGLVPACRYCGLLEASVAAHDEARRLDPQVPTSVVHSLWMLGEYQRSINEGHGLTDAAVAAALALVGRQDDAIAELRKAEERFAGSTLGLLTSLGRTAIERKPDEFLTLWRQLESCEGSPLGDSENMFYMARSSAYVGQDDLAMDLLRRAIDGGFFCVPVFLRDPALERLRARAEFGDLLQRAQTHHREAVTAFLSAGGGQLLGVSMLSAPDVNAATTRLDLA